MTKLETAIKALEYYAKGQRDYSDEDIGTLIEFGCGCCSGKVVDNYIEYPHMKYEPGSKGITYDNDVVGQTARDALKIITGPSFGSDQKTKPE